VKTQYLAQDGKTATEFAEQGKFREAEAQRLAADHPFDRFVERTSHQPGLRVGDLTLVPYWRVRVTVTSEDRARLRGQDPSRATSLANPRRARARPCMSHADSAELERAHGVPHQLQFTRPVGYDLFATFSPTEDGQHVYVRTANWKYEDEYHDWMPVRAARELYREMVEAGWEAF